MSNDTLSKQALSPQMTLCPARGMKDKALSNPANCGQTRGFVEEGTLLPTQLPGICEEGRMKQDSKGDAQCL